MAQAKSKKIPLTGDQAVATAMKQIDPDVVAAYPITPQTEIVMYFSNYVANGQVSTELIPVESEHSAMSACVGAQAAGARTMTATSANGLALMWEVVYIAASTRLPIVMPVVNRALSGPINIHCDHSDTMGARDAGWIQLFAENAQEAYENTIQAIRIAEHPDISLPCMTMHDGFIISHGVENVTIYQDELVRKFIGEYKPQVSLLDAAGFRSGKTIHTRKNTHIREYILQRYGTVPQPVNSGAYSVRSFRIDDFEAELERVREIFNDAFSSNWHFLPLTSAEYVFSAKFLNLVTRPELITFVEHEGKPVGVLECVLDINPLLKRLRGSIGPIKYFRYLHDKKDVRSLIIYAVGIKKAFQGTRVYKLLLDSLCAQATAYDSLETTWMSEDNLLALRAAEHLGLERDKEFTIYQRDLHPQQS